MNTNNLSRDLRFNITNLRELYESNNNLLINITHVTNQNFSSTNITSLVDNLITTNNEILNTIMNLTNQHVLNNNRQTNNNTRQQHNNNYSNRPNYHTNRQNYLNNPTINNLVNTFFDPIEIYPTPYQIELATRVARFGDIVNPLNLACPISLENFNDNDQVLVIRQCNHIFSNTALNSWFRTNCRCPVCRYDIRDHVSNNAINISSLASNIDLSSNIIPSSFNRAERTTTPTSTVLIDLLFSNLLDPPVVTDISGNNLLQFLFRH
jgi:hypothetical protein